MSDAEETLITSNPSMFGVSPVKFLLLWLVSIAGVVGFIMFFMSPPGIIAGILALLAAGWLLIWWIDVKFQDLTVTNERTIYKHGILNTKSSEVQHDDVRNMQVEQSIFQRMIGVGDIAISSAGQGDMEIQVKGFKDPNEIVEVIRKYQ